VNKVVSTFRLEHIEDFAAISSLLFHSGPSSTRGITISIDAKLRYSLTLMQ
jgi:hypothetical protein